MIILDTTVLAYAVGDAHPLRDACQMILQRHTAGTIHAMTTFEVVQEFVHIRSRRRTRAEAVELGLDYARMLPLLAVEREDMELGLDLYVRTTLGAFDAVLAAVAVNRGAEGLASADRAFSGVPGLKWIDVAAPKA